MKGGERGERGRERMSRGRAPARAWECGGVARCNGYRRHLRLPIAGGPAPNGQVSWEAPPPGPRGEGCQRPPKLPGAAQLPQQPFSASQQLLRGRGSRAPSPRRAELGCQPRLLGARSPPPSLDRPSYLLKSLPVLCPLAAFVPSLSIHGGCLATPCDPDSPALPFVLPRPFPQSPEIRGTPAETRDQDPGRHCPGMEKGYPTVPPTPGPCSTLRG